MNADHTQPVLAIDIGNTMTKLGVVDTHQWSCRARLSFPTRLFEQHFVDAVDELCTVFGGDRGVPVALTNVGGVPLGRIEQMLANKHLGPLLVVSADTDLPLWIAYRDPTVLGTDRLAQALYCRRCHPERNTIVIAAGTAVTIDVITAAGHFTGGAIFPGPATQLRALHAHTAALPEITTTAATALRAGTSTADCMIVGVLGSVVGGIETLVGRFSAQLDAPVDLVATGGAWPTLAPVSTLEVLYVPDATLLGAASYALCKTKPSS